MNHWKTVKSIWQKVEAKNPLGTMNNACTVTPTKPFALQVHYGVKMGVSNHNPNGVQICVCATYKAATQNHVCSHVRFLNFDTETERYNAWQSYLTKFVRFCICMDESTKLAPYMGDYTQSWDDQRFYEYFGLNKIEIQLIESVIK